MLTLLVLLSLLTACGQTATPEKAEQQPAQKQATEAPAAKPATKEAAPAADTQEDPALASDYSQAILKDMATVVDTSQYKKDGPYTIAVSQQDPSNGWGNTYNVTIAAYGKELEEQGVLAGPLLTSITNDANQQISDIENFIEQQPDAIVVEPLGRAASTAVIKRAIRAGIPVILCANGIEGDDFTTRVDVDFYEVAYKSGDGLAKLMGGKGKVVVFNGIAGVDSTETWQAAALDAFSKYPDIEIVATEYAQWNIATAKQKMEAIMAANPDIDGVWAGGGEMALGAALAYEDAGLEPPKFAMVNVPNGFLRLALQYGYEFVGAPDPPSMSKYCLQTAIDVLQGKEVTKFISLKTLMDGAEPYDNTNFKQWYVPELNDDFIPPATVDIQYYIDGGFGRKGGAAVMEEEVSDIAAIINSPEVNKAAQSSDYSQAILKDMATAVDASEYKKDGPYTIAVSQQDPSNGWGNTYNVTISAYGKELEEQGVLAGPLLTSITNDANQQISDIENFIEQQPDAIVVEPLGRAASTTVIKRAIRAGIPVVLCANGIEGDDFTARVDVDFYEVAYKSGIGLAELMGGKGKVVVFNGIAGVDSTETWQAAALDAFSKYPDIEIVATEYAQWNIATAKQKMEAIMAANPDIDGVWAGGGEMALGAGLAYEDAGLEPPKFAMVNVPNGFLRLAKEYGYEFVGAPDPPSMSKYCLQTAVDILQGKEVTKFISLKTLMDGAEPYDNTDFIQWYVPELNDDFIPPATVDVQYYIDGGFGRK